MDKGCDVKTTLGSGSGVGGSVGGSVIGVYGRRNGAGFDCAWQGAVSDCSLAWLAVGAKKLLWTYGRSNRAGNNCAGKGAISDGSLTWLAVGAKTVTGWERYQDTGWKLEAASATRPSGCGSGWRFGTRRCWLATSAAVLEAIRKNGGLETQPIGRTKGIATNGGSPGMDGKATPNVGI
jgi:hypothetical protein